MKTELRINWMRESNKTSSISGNGKQSIQSSNQINPALIHAEINSNLNGIEVCLIDGNELAGWFVGIAGFDGLISCHFSEVWFLMPAVINWFLNSGFSLMNPEWKSEMTAWNSNWAGYGVAILEMKLAKLNCRKFNWRHFIPLLQLPSEFAASNFISLLISDSLIDWFDWRHSV